ncbi:hemerythrin domain-containing protein [Actinophytocola glycyrrhizae]|uniref:Hemerythrin domain-containing protein n=1 Tax=Actinophytocola glycyrrhizae TaxID=2044873 RepID=A0ABV9S2L9_9PSEU
MTSSERDGEDPRGRAVYEHLVEVHALYRRELAKLRGEMAKWSADPGGPDRLADAARAFSDQRKSDLRLNCLQFCDALTAHHSVEDTQMFPQLRDYSAAAAPVVDRLRMEHEKIADLLAQLENTLRRLSGDPSLVADAARALTALATDLEAHLDNEENSLAGLFGLR